jgi:hypothetical protein
MQLLGTGIESGLADNLVATTIITSIECLAEMRSEPTDITTNASGSGYLEALPTS